MDKKQPKVSTRNTKEQIFSAYKDVLKELNERSKSSFNGEKELEQKNNRSTLDLVTNLKIEDFNELIVNMTGKLSEFKEIDKAIAIKKEELSDIYGLESELNSFSALVEAKKSFEDDWKEKFDRDKSEKLENLNDEIETLKEQIEGLKKEKKQNKEEWEYSFKREKLKREDELTDELEQKRREMNEELLKLTKEKTELEEAKTELKKSEEELVAEKAKLAEKLEDEKKKIEEKAKRSFDYRLTIEKTSNESKMKILENSVATQELTIARLEKELEDTRAKLDAAYTRIQEISIANVNSKKVDDVLNQVKSAVTKPGKE